MNPNRSLWHRHTSLNIFWPQLISRWTTGQIRGFNKFNLIPGVIKIIFEYTVSKLAIFIASRKLMLRINNSLS